MAKQEIISRQNVLCSNCLTYFTKLSQQFYFLSCYDVLCKSCCKVNLTNKTIWCPQHKFYKSARQLDDETPQQILKIFSPMSDDFKPLLHKLEFWVKYEQQVEKMQNNYDLPELKSRLNKTKTEVSKNLNEYKNLRKELIKEVIAKQLNDMVDNTLRKAEQKILNQPSSSLFAPIADSNQRFNYVDNNSSFIGIPLNKTDKGKPEKVDIVVPPPSQFRDRVIKQERGDQQQQYHQQQRWDQQQQHRFLHRLGLVDQSLLSESNTTIDLTGSPPEPRYYKK